MSEPEFERWLSNLQPSDLERDLSAELEQFGAGAPEAGRRLEEHLRYLRLISARQVQTPEESYFASARSRILSRVEIRPVSLGERIRALLLPEEMRLFIRKSATAITATRPSPALAALALATLALMIGVVMFYPYSATSPDSGLERYLSLQQRFSAELSPMQKGRVLDEIDSGQIDVLLRSAAILSSPSSLSRSWINSFGRK